MLLSEGPMHAYQIEKEIENREMRFWTEISMSSIYKLLNKLAREGLVAKRREDAENGNTKNVFRLTNMGLSTFRSRLREILSEPEHLRWRIDLATSHLDALPRQEAIDCLRTYRRRLEETARDYERLQDYLVGDGCPTHAHALAKRPQHLLKGELVWLEEYIAELESEEGESPPTPYSAVDSTSPAPGGGR